MINFFGGVNTAEPELIKDTDSSFNLNCFNKNGALRLHSYSVDKLPATIDIFRREYGVGYDYFGQYTENSIVTGKL